MEEKHIWHFLIGFCLRYNNAETETFKAMLEGKVPWATVIQAYIYLLAWTALGKPGLCP